MSGRSAVSQPYPLLLSPTTLRGRTVRNRIASTPHATGWGHDGLLSSAEVAYHARKARGGCGLVMTFGSASVDPASAAAYGSISLWDERNEPALRALASEVQRAGALCLSQMTHMGRRGSSIDSGLPLRSASDVPEPVHREVPVPLEADEIEAIVRRFGEAAARLRACGWDGCEVTSFGGHLIEQFLDPAVNLRTDRYGGDLDGRLRFAREVLAAVRAAAGDDFIVGFRMTLDQCLPDPGLAPDALQGVAVALAGDGVVDLLSVSGGTGATPVSQAATVPPDALPPATYAELAGAAKRRVGDLRVLLAGRVLDGASAERCLRETGVDLVAMTRAIIAEPDLPGLLASGGRPRPCISINQGCIGRLYEHGPVGCTINPAIREPRLEQLEPAARSRRVVVVGAGVAGLEAARAAALRGHAVTVLERREEVGGRARLAARWPGRERWLLYLDWLRDEAVAAGATLHLATEAHTETLVRLEPEAVVLATGSRAREERRGGGLPLRDADAVLEDGPDPGWRGRAILVVDEEGRWVAPTVAERLALAGSEVEVVTPLPSVGADIDPTQYPFVQRRLVEAGVRLTPNSTWHGVRDGAAVVGHAFAAVAPERREVAGVVLATARAADTSLRDELRARVGGLELRVVGDALAPRLLHDAAAEGARAGASI